MPEKGKAPSSSHAAASQFEGEQTPATRHTQIQTQGDFQTEFLQPSTNIRTKKNEVDSRYVSLFDADPRPRSMDLQGPQPGNSCFKSDQKL